MKPEYLIIRGNSFANLKINKKNGVQDFVKNYRKNLENTKQKFIYLLQYNSRFNTSLIQNKFKSEVKKVQLSLKKLIQKIL